MQKPSFISYCSLFFNFVQVSRDKWSEWVSGWQRESWQASKTCHFEFWCSCAKLQPHAHVQPQTILPHEKSLREKTSPRILPLLILVSPPCLPLLHTRSALLSFSSPSLALRRFSGKGTRGTTHCVQFSIAHTFFRADDILDDLAWDSDPSIFLVVPNRFHFEAFPVEFVSVE